MRGKSFSLYPFEEEQMLYSTKQNVAELWHKKLGHYHFQGLVKIQKLKMVESLPDLEENSTECHAWQFGKKHRKPFPKSTWRA
uniref:Putative ovule protein n=1 Tax=Solanum chacoense TaxID=4108 RepID=A0A0V0GMQ0_SOLCH